MNLLIHFKMFWLWIKDNEKDDCYLNNKENKQKMIDI